MNKTTMTPEIAKEALAKYGSLRKAGKALGVDGATVLKWSRRAGGGNHTAHTSCEPETSAPAPSVTGGITLSATTRFSDKKPPASVRAKFYTLPKGKAFTIADLSKDWHFSQETIRRHAKDEGCWAYIDTTGHDDWVEVVMHPETAKARLQGK